VCVYECTVRCWRVLCGNLMPEPLTQVENQKLSSLGSIIVTQVENQKLSSLGSIIVTNMCIYFLNILLNKM